MQSLKEMFKGSNGKVDHKRITVFLFVFLVFFITAIALFKSKVIPNESLVEYILVISATVITGGMTLTKVNINKKKDEEPNAN